MPEKFIQQLAAGKSLTPEQVGEAVEWLVTESVPAAAKADFLGQLAQRGETVEEIAAFAQALHSRAVAAPLDEQMRRLQNEKHELKEEMEALASQVRQQRAA